MVGEEPSNGPQQLQAAALGMIAASRAVLDAFETLVRDPATAGEVTATLGQVARAVVDAVARSWAGPVRPSPDDGELERIEVS